METSVTPTQAAGAGGVKDAAGAVDAAAGSTAVEGICGSIAFPRGREVLEVIGHLVEAMQGRNNPLNRWFPWRQVRVRPQHAALA
jgi:hypothetical protein